MREIDVRGLACPEPVVMTMRALMKDPSGVRVLGDTVASKENIARFAAAKGYTLETEERDGAFVLTLKK